MVASVAAQISADEALRTAADESHRVNATSVILISDKVVEELQEWSPPVQIKFLRGLDSSGVVHLEVRKAST